MMANHSQEWKIDLQLFAEEGPIGEPEPEPEGEPTGEPIDEPNGEPQPEGEPQGEPQGEPEPFLKIKYNKEEVALDREKAVELAQKGMNYDKILQRLQALENDPRLTFVENQAKKYGMTVEQYLDAVREAEEQERLNELIQQNIPEELAKEIMENRKFREQWEQERKAREEAEKREADYKAFLETFPDVKPEDIPESVWKDVEENGKSLVDAYTRYENQLLKEQLAKLQEGKVKEKQNEENANSTTGSVTGKGDGKQPYFTREQVEKMSVEEINKNWKAIMESQKHWYK